MEDKIIYLEEDVGEDPIEKYDFDCSVQGLDHDWIQADGGFEVCVTCGLCKEEIDDEIYTVDTKENEELKDTYRAILPLLYDGASENTWLNSFVSKIERSEIIVKIKKKAFNKLRKIAFEAFLYKGTETSAVLYGKNNTITKVKKYDAIESGGLVTSNGSDILKVLTQKNFIGFFHSHVFESATPSGTDKNCLSGWASLRDPKPVYSFIGCPPYFKQRVWSMDNDLKIQEHDLKII